MGGVGVEEMESSRLALDTVCGRVLLCDIGTIHNF